MEVYMDNLSVYRNHFHEALENLGKLLVRCQETKLALIDDKCHMFQTKRIFLAYVIFYVGIEVDPKNT